MIALLLLLQQEASPGWTFLVDKYDENSDGCVTPSEYPRSAGSFDRLDRDGDGLLRPQDFAEEMAALWRDQYMQAPALQDLLMQNFQEDGGPGLERAEFLRQAAAADAGRDGSLNAEDCAARGLGEAWQQFALSLDPDGGGTVTLDELAALFDRLDVNGDGLLLPPDLQPVILPLQPEGKPLALVFGSFT